MTKSVHHHQIALLIATFLVAAAGCSQSQDQSTAKRSNSAVVVPYTVQYQAKSLAIEAVGTARARRSSLIYAETGGEVTAVAFQPGQFVSKSDVVVRLEDRQERLAVKRAEIAVKDAEQLLDRYSRIDVPGAISDSQIDEAKTALDAAQIELQIAQNSLSERIVRAPFSGHLGLSSIDAGTRITPANAITQLDDRTELFVEFDVPENFFGRISVGDRVKAAPFANFATAFEAEVVALDSSIDPITRAFRVRTTINNSSDALRPGMSFKIAFNLTGQSYPAVPEAAVVWGSDGPYLWTVEEGLARRVSLTLIERTQGFVLVKGDIAEGATIIARGVQRVREGSPIVFDANAATLNKDAAGATQSSGQ